MWFKKCCVSFSKIEKKRINSKQELKEDGTR